MLQGGAGAGLSPAAAVQRINREKAVVIDVCEPDEFAAGHVGGARSIPWASWRPSCPARSRTRPRRWSGVRLGRAGAPRGGHRAQAGLRAGRGAGRRHEGWREANLPVERS
jgi:hypothetical protein